MHVYVLRSRYMCIERQQRVILLQRLRKCVCHLLSISLSPTAPQISSNRAEVHRYKNSRNVPSQCYTYQILSGPSRNINKFSNCRMENYLQWFWQEVGIRVDVKQIWCSWCLRRDLGPNAGICISSTLSIFTVFRFINPRD